MAYDRRKPVSIYNHNHSFDERLRCVCGTTWNRVANHPTRCPKRAAERNKRNTPEDKKPDPPPAPF